jgi:hypothetical protein
MKIIISAATLAYILAAGTVTVLSLRPQVAATSYPCGGIGLCTHRGHRNGAELLL